MTALTPIDRLEDAWRAYRRAILGELNVTAERLRQAASEAGWSPYGYVRVGFAPWAVRELIKLGRLPASEDIWAGS